MKGVANFSINLTTSKPKLKKKRSYLFKQMDIPRIKPEIYYLQLILYIKLFLELFPLSAIRILALFIQNNIESSKKTCLFYLAHLLDQLQSFYFLFFSSLLKFIITNSIKDKVKIIRVNNFL